MQNDSALAPQQQWQLQHGGLCTGFPSVDHLGHDCTRVCGELGAPPAALQTHKLMCCGPKTQTVTSIMLI